MVSKNTILSKRTTTLNLIPTINQLSAGEIFVQVADGKIYLKQENGINQKIVKFLNSDDYPYTLDKTLSSIVINYGNNNVTDVLSNILGGYNNLITGAGSVILNGENNQITSDFGFIGSGFNNSINPNGQYSAILGGRNNKIIHENSFTIGSDLSSNAENFTYVNNLSSQGFLYGDGRFITGISSGNNQDSEVRSLTGNWQSTYAQVNSLSSSWGGAATGTLTQELSVIATSQGLYSDGDKIPVGTSIETILINMLRTSIPPIYSSPTLSVAYGSPTVVGTYEVGSTVSSFTITPTFNTNDSGGLINFVYYKDASNLGTGSSKSVSSFTINSSTTLQVSAGYSQGSIKNDNLGNPYPTGRINAGSLTNSATLNVLYPYFWGTSSTLPTAASIASDIQNGSANKVLASASGTVSVTYNANGEYIWLAHTADQTEKTKWYVTALNSGSIGSGQAINSPVTRNVTSPDAYWSGVSFKIYISSGQQATTGAFEYRNS